MLVTPDKTVTIGPRQFTLVGSFGVLRDLQHSFAMDIIPLQSSIMTMRQDEIAKIIAIGSGGNEDDIGQLIFDEMGVTDSAYILLKAEVMTWLLLAMTPKRDREKKSAELAKIIDGITKSLSSHGTTTSESQPAS